MNKENIVVEETKRLLNEEQILLEMAKIEKRDYGLPINIWIDEAGVTRNTPHNYPRIKFENSYDDSMKHLVPLTLTQDPEIPDGVNVKLNISERDLNKVKDFVRRNYDILMQRWNCEISTKQMFKLLDANN